MIGSHLPTTIRWTVLITFIGSLVLFFPILPDFYQTGKFIFLIIGALVLLLLNSIFVIFSKDIIIPRPSYVIGYVALMTSSFLSLFITSSSKLEAFMDPISGTALFITLTALVGVSHLFFDANMRLRMKWSLFVSIGLLSIIAIYMHVGTGKLIFPHISYLSDPLWTPIGSAPAFIAISFIILPLLIEELILHIKRKHEVGISSTIIISLAVLAGITVTSIQLFPQLHTISLPLSTAWNILMETYKSFINALFGTGIDNYLFAFVHGRPASLNMTEIWNLRFTVGSNTFIHVATTLGITGIIALVLWMYTQKQLFHTAGLGLKVSMIMALLALLVIPPHITIWIVTALLGILSENHIRSSQWSPGRKWKWILQAIGTVGILTSITCFYFLMRFLSGEIAIKKSLQSAEVKDGTATYNNQIKAIQLNPWNTNYHISFSRTNLALANSIVSNATSVDKTSQLSDTDRTLVSELLQQSIREAKFATSMSPKNIIAWENLATVYQSITGIVAGSDEWAIASYQQSVVIDPTNPMLRLNLAGMYIRILKYDEAINQLQIALALKPNLASISYNLANVYSMTKEYFKQAVALKQTLALLPAGSEDADTVKQALEEVLPYLNEKELASLAEVKTGVVSVDEMPLIPLELTPAPTFSQPIELPEISSPSADVMRDSTPELPSPTSNP